MPPTSDATQADANAAEESTTPEPVIEVFREPVEIATAELQKESASRFEDACQDEPETAEAETHHVANPKQTEMASAGEPVALVKERHLEIGEAGSAFDASEETCGELYVFDQLEHLSVQDCREKLIVLAKVHSGIEGNTHIGIGRGQDGSAPRKGKGSSGSAGTIAAGPRFRISLCGKGWKSTSERERKPVRRDSYHNLVDVPWRRAWEIRQAHLEKQQHARDVQVCTSDLEVDSEKLGQERRHFDDDLDQDDVAAGDNLAKLAGAKSNAASGAGFAKAPSKVELFNIATPRSAKAEFDEDEEAEATIDSKTSTTIASPESEIAANSSACISDLVNLPSHEIQVVRVELVKRALSTLRTTKEALPNVLQGKAPYALSEHDSCSEPEQEHASGSVSASDDDPAIKEDGAGPTCKETVAQTPTSFVEDQGYERRSVGSLRAIFDKMPTILSPLG